MISDGLLDVKVGQQVPSHFYMQDDVSISFDNRQMTIKDSSGNETVKIAVSQNGQLVFQAYDPNTGDWSEVQSLTPIENSNNSTQLPHASTQNYIEIDANGFKVYLAGTLKATINSQGLALQDLPIVGIQQTGDMTEAINRQTFEDARYDLKTNPNTSVARVLNIFGQPVVVVGNTFQSQLKMQYSQRPAQFVTLDIPDTQYVNDEIATCQQLSEKGQTNGYAPLDSFGYVPSNHLPIMQLNQTYVGNDADKTNPATYPTQLPIRGTLYIASDTQRSYILAGDDYTSDSTWIQLAPTLNVLSINGKTGVVSISSDDVPEGVGNLYFASGMSNYLNTYANTIGNLLKLNNAGLIQSQFYGDRIVLNNGVVAIRDDQSQALYFENASTGAQIFKVQSDSVQSEVPISYSTRPIFNSNQQLIDKQYVDDSISIFATDKIHDSTNNSKVICSDSSTITFQTSGQTTASITNQQDTAIIQSKGLNFTIQGDNTASNTVTISGNRAESLLNSTKLNLIQSYFGSKTCQSEINLAVDGSQGAALQLQAGIDTSMPVGQQNSANIQSQSPNTDLIQISVGIANNDATFKIIADKHVASIPIQIQADRKTGYSSQIAITEDQQFTSKQYVDTKMPLAYSLADIASRNAVQNNVDLNGQQLINVANPLSAQQVATKNYVDTQSITTLSNQIADYDTQGYKITGLADAVNSTDAVNKQTADSRYYLNTVTLNNITAPDSSLSLNNQKITNLSTPTLAQDATTKSYVDIGLNTKYNSTTALNNITAPINHVSLNNYKLINVQDPTLAQDAASKNYVDTGLNLKYDNTTTLDNITIPTANVNFNNTKLINVYDPTLAQDAATKNYVDSGLNLKYDKTTTLNNIIAPSGDVDINNYKLRNVQDPALAQDVTTKLYVDTGLNLKYDKTTALNNITTATGSLNLGGQKIVNVLDPILAQDVATKNYTDTALDLKYDKTTTLDSITAPTSNLSLNNNKIVNLLDPTLAQDAATKNYVDTGLSTKYDDTVTLDSITAPTNNLSLNNKKIVNLAEPTLAQDATTKAYVDSGLALKQDNTVTLDAIQAPIANMNLNGQKITNLGNATQAQDSLNLQTADSRYYLNTVTLNNIAAATSAVDLNAQKLTNVQNPTLAQDATTKIYVDDGLNTKYANTTTLDQIVKPTADVDVNNNKMTNLLDPTLAQDAASKNYVDTGLQTKYTNTTTLDNIQPPTGSLSLNSQLITNLADAVSATDALNKQTADSIYYLNTVTLNNITAPTSSLNLSGQKIVNLLDPTVAQDSATKNYVDNGLQTKYNNTTTLDSITAPANSLNLNSQKIVSLANPTLAQDAATKIYVDNGLNLKYDNTTTLNQIVIPTANLDLNGHKIIGLADAVDPTDALNKQTGDNRYYLNTTTLNNVSAPTASLSLNSQKITNVADPTLAQDAATKNYVDVGLNLKYDNTTTLDNVVAATSSVSLNSQKIVNMADPTLTYDAATKNYVDNGLQTKYTNTTTLNNIAVPTGSLDLNSQQIINLLDPTLAQDAATKNYVDIGLNTKYSTTTTLNQITAPTTAVSLNNQKIVNLANGTASTDAVNSGQLTSAISGLSTTYMPLNYRLDQISAPTASISLNSQKITSLLDPTLAQDAATKNYVDSGLNTKYSNTVTLNNITAPTGSVDVNSQKITNLANGTANTDAANYGQLTSAISGLSSTYMPLTERLDQISAPTASLNLNNQKIVNLLDPTLTQDATTKNYVDNGLITKYDSTVTLNNITAPTASLSLNSQKIINVADPTLDQDATTKIYVDTGLNTKYNSTTTLDNITAPTSDLSLNNQKIINVADPINAQDVATKFYVDQSTSVGNASQIANAIVSTSKLVANQTELTNGSTPLNMNSQKISSLTDPTLAQDAATKNYVDAGLNAKYNSTTTLDNITAPTGSLSLNSQKITNVAAGTVSSDAVNKGQLDGKYDNTLTLQNIQTAHPITANLDLGIYGVTTTQSSFSTNNLISRNYLESSYARLPIGTILAYYGTSIPSGFLLCDGSTFSSTTYPDLYAFLGYVNVLPDLRGYFLRGKSYATGRDQAGDRTIGNTQADGNQAHNHQYKDVVLAETFAGAVPSISVRGSNGGSDASGNQFLWRTEDPTTGAQGTTINWTDANASINTTTQGNTETTVKNVCVNYIIVASLNASGISTVAVGSSSDISLSNTYRVINAADPISIGDYITIRYLNSIMKQNEYVQLICTNSFPAVNNFLGDTNWSIKNSRTSGNYLSYSSSDGSISLVANQDYEVQVSFTSSGTNLGQIILYNGVSGNTLALDMFGINTTANTIADPWWCEVRVYQASGWHSGTPTIIIKPTSNITIRAKLINAVPSSYTTYMLQIKTRPHYFVNPTGIV